jgi:hypothetical protein
MNINVSLGEYIDLLSIAKISSIKTDDKQVRENKQKEFSVLYSSFKDIWLDYYSRIFLINYKIWLIKQRQKED